LGTGSFDGGYVLKVGYSPGATGKAIPYEKIEVFALGGCFSWDEWQAVKIGW